mmetsp:Transcript_19696/g.46107  ORF Transcript_19696/g.46107 Transcript_19696/m.46107 type:complete len:281 (+) Transcript_19696:672-1514(+)
MRPVAQRVEANRARGSPCEVDAVAAAACHDGEECAQALQARVPETPAVVLPSVHQIDRVVLQVGERHRNQGARLRVAVHRFNHQLQVAPVQRAGAQVRVPAGGAGLAPRPVQSVGNRPPCIIRGARVPRWQHVARESHPVGAHRRLIFGASKYSRASTRAPEGAVLVVYNCVLVSVAVHRHAVVDLDPAPLGRIQENLVRLLALEPRHHPCRHRVHRIRTHFTGADGRHCSLWTAGGQLVAPACEGHVAQLAASVKGGIGARHLGPRFLFWENCDEVRRE